MIKGSHLSEEAKHKISIAVTGKNHPMFGRTGEKSPWFGKKHSHETLNKMSIAQKGRFVSEETRRKISESRKGFHPSEETRKKLSESHLGEKNPLWGKHHSEETRRKISKSHIGLLAGEKSPMWGRTGGKNPMFGRTGEKAPMFGMVGDKAPFYGRHHTEESRRKMSEKHIGLSVGEKSPNWRGGNRGGYPPEFARIAPLIRLRDNGLCVLCRGFEQSRRKPSVHHIDCHKGNNDLLNLVTVCSTCHRKIHITTDSEQDYEIILSNWVQQKYGYGGLKLGT